MREYQHDVQIPCWRKADGPLDGVSLVDTNGVTVEFDENLDGGALAGRFTCMRSYSNGPLGAYIALSLTRDSGGRRCSRVRTIRPLPTSCRRSCRPRPRTQSAKCSCSISDGTGTEVLSLEPARAEGSTARFRLRCLQQFQEGPRAKLGDVDGKLAPTCLARQGPRAQRRR